MTISTKHVLQLVLQFLQENGLSESADVLQKESGVQLNTITVEKLDQVRGLLEKEHWADLFSGPLKGCLLSVELTYTLYTHFLSHLVRSKRDMLAKQILTFSPDLIRMKSCNMKKYDRLVSLVHDPNSKYLIKDELLPFEKEELVNNLMKQLQKDEGSQLLHLLGNAMADNESSLTERESDDNFSWVSPGPNGPQKSDSQLHLKQPSSLSSSTTQIYRAPPRVKRPRRTCANGAKLVCKLNIGGSVNHMAFQHGRNSITLVTASDEGLIELWNCQSGKLRTDLQYQNANMKMKHSGRIRWVCFSPDNSRLASCTEDSSIRVWDIKSGITITNIANAHSTKSVNCIKFSPCGEVLLSGGSDYTARTHGSVSGKLLHSFGDKSSGHKAAVTCVLYLDAGRFVSGSVDHDVRIWSINSGQLMYQVKLDAPILSMARANILGNVDSVVVCQSSSSMPVLDMGCGTCPRIGDIELPAKYSNYPSPQPRFVGLAGGNKGGNATCCMYTDDGKVYLSHTLLPDFDPVLIPITSKASPESVCLSSFGTQLALATSKCQVHLYSIWRAGSD